MKRRRHDQLVVYPSNAMGLAVIRLVHDGRGHGVVGMYGCIWHMATGHAFPSTATDDFQRFDLVHRVPEEVRFMEAHIDYWTAVWMTQRLDALGVDLVEFLARPHEILAELDIEVSAPAMEQPEPDPAPKVRWAGFGFLQSMKRKGPGLRFRLGRA